MQPSADDWIGKETGKNRNIPELHNKFRTPASFWNGVKTGSARDNVLEHALHNKLNGAPGEKIKTIKQLAQKNNFNLGQFLPWSSSQFARDYVGAHCNK